MQEVEVTVSVNGCEGIEIGKCDKGDGGMYLVVRNVCCEILRFMR
jgi:hypothetical protein